MLNILLSHWMTYVYVAYVTVLIVLCIVYRPRVTTVYHKLKEIRTRTWRAPSGYRTQLITTGPHSRH
jgi:hypothetical protein